MARCDSELAISAPWAGGPGLCALLEHVLAVTFGFPLVNIAAARGAVWRDTYANNGVEAVP